MRLVDRHSIAYIRVEPHATKPGLYQLQIARQRDRLGAAGDLELAENVVGVGLLCRLHRSAKRQDGPCKRPAQTETGA